jgi:hypothetical protein
MTMVVCRTNPGQLDWASRGEFDGLFRLARGNATRHFRRGLLTIRNPHNRYDPAMVGLGKVRMPLEQSHDGAGAKGP